MNQSTYLQLSTEYYERERPVAPQAAFAFYLNNAKSIEGPILEPMCGSGRFLIPLCQAGMEVHGFDPSRHMLDKLLVRCQEFGINPTISQKTFQEINLEILYELIIIPSGSFALITNLDEAKICLQKAYYSLKEGGKFLFELENKHSSEHLHRHWKGDLQKIDDGRNIIRSRLSSADDKHTATIIEKYELVEGTQIIKTEIEIFKVRYYSNESMCQMLKEIGFKDVKLFKPFDRERTPDSEDEVVVYECVK